MTATILDDEIEDRSSRREEPLPVVSPYLEHCGKLKAQLVQYTVEKYREQISRAIHQHEDPEGVDTIIIDDFIYHGRASGAATGTIDEFLRLHPELPPEDQTLLGSWKQAILGVFESIDFDHANCTLKALNLIDELEYKIALTVVDSEIMNAIKTGNFNLSRIVPVKNVWTFSGKLMPFDRADSRYAYAQAAELAMKHPAWFFRNPLHLKMAREKALKSHEKFLEQFDASWIAGPPAQIEARYRAFLSMSKNAETESSDVTYPSFAIRAKAQSKSAISQLKLPAALHRAKSVGMISHPEDGVYFLPEFSLFLKMLNRPRLVEEDHPYELLHGYFHEELACFSLFPLVAKTHRKQLNALLAAFTGKQNFDWGKDGPVLLKQFHSEEAFKAQRYPSSLPLNNRMADGLLFSKELDRKKRQSS